MAEDFSGGTFRREAVRGPRDRPNCDEMRLACVKAPFCVPG